MNHSSTTRTTRTLLSVAAALLTAVSSMACSGSALETAPFAPSAVPALTLSVESGDAAADTWSTLDKGKDKDKGKDRAAAAAAVVEAEGVVATVTGSCPAKTFTVGQHSITTSAATTYDDGLCADLVALAEVEVRATRQADGTLVATRVEFEDAGADDDEDGDDEGEDDEDEGDDDEGKEDGRGNPHHGAGPHRGTVSSFRGACPAVTFNLKGLRISTTAATKYEGGTCEMLRPNVQVVVTGAAGTEPRTFVAQTVTIVRRH